MAATYFGKGMARENPLSLSSTIPRAQVELEASNRTGADRSLAQNSSPFASKAWTPFSPLTVWVTRKSTASEQNW